MCIKEADNLAEYQNTKRHSAENRKNKFLIFPDSLEIESNCINELIIYIKNNSESSAGNSRNYICHSYNNSNTKDSDNI